MGTGNIKEAAQRMKQALDKVAAARNNPEQFEKAIQEARQQCDAMASGTGSEKD